MGRRLDHLAEITFVAAGDTIPQRRGPGRDEGEPELGPASREEAIRILADGSRPARPALCRHTDRGPQGRRRRLAEADEAARSADDKAPLSPVDARLGPVGVSGIQQNRGRAQFMTPRAGKPGHNAAINGRMWLFPRAGRDLWRALTSPPPPSEWLDLRGFDAVIKEASATIRDARARMPQLLRRRSSQDVTLLADLSTAVGRLSGRSSFATRKAKFVTVLLQLRKPGS